MFNLVCVPNFSFTVLQASQAKGQYPCIPGALGLIWRHTRRLSIVYPEGTVVGAVGLLPPSFPPHPTPITGKLQGHNLDKPPLCLYGLWLLGKFQLNPKLNFHTSTPVSHMH